ncbi:LysM peptidoglycan-binding domain-containing protein [Metabacillus sp. KIGAM252]|uniref:LysM peptidoglycan-binding domain-containing protein n=1 Tax=Metabacillus flavus TaxID=2823519 RepID=A0ABS5LAU6_9BACI|nr:LysM peptidoglycan-binding domain-containing protein [Metabacillus flavus]MBS2967830.1 LysM peptidoglycan-binding domain-containing protein [Metabacillus flavus]
MKKSLFLGVALAGAISFAAASDAEAASSQTYRVKSGDSLSKIANVYKVTVSQLKQWNHLKTDIIYAGKTLYVKNPAAAQATASSSKKHIVRSGETLSSISKKYGVAIDKIKEANRLKSAVIKTGQTLVIPKAAPVKTTSTVKTPAPAKTPAKAAAPAKATTYYIVKPGNTLSAIAKLFNTSVQEIKRLNSLKSDKLLVGQKLKMTEGVLPVLAEGVFPLKPGSFQTYPNSWGNSRTYGGSRTHEGIDIMAKKGTPIYSVTDGVIERYGWNELGGWRLTIRTKEGYRIYYAHLDQYAAGMKQGLSVKKGQFLGTVGDSGYGKTGTKGKFAPHLHIGVYNQSFQAVNPYPFLIYWERN